MMRILLINPGLAALPGKGKGALTTSVPHDDRHGALFGCSAYMAPLGVATVAALTPDAFEVDIWDEAVHGRIGAVFDVGKQYDLVGVTGLHAHRRRVLELGALFRGTGPLVVAGGAGLSASPEHYRDAFDVLFVGEAEYTWPRFLAEWQSGSHRKEYLQVAKVEMTDSPLPRWDALARVIRSYYTGAVQTTRGCPFDCEFCDVVAIYGRRARHKNIDQVLVEVSRLEQLGVERIFFCDDNFYGAPSYARDLMRELVGLNRSFRRPLDFFTQLSLNVAKDDVMLGLLADASFTGVFIGIESPNVESLKETNKPQNYRTDMLRDVRKIQSYGLVVEAGMIVGFDHDKADIFDRQFDFLQQASIVETNLNLLHADPGTRLWERLRSEGRLLDLSREMSSHSVVKTNIIPKGMTRLELLTGFRELVRRVRNWRAFEARVRGLIDGVRRRPGVTKRSPPLVAQLRFLRIVLSELGLRERVITLGLLLHTLRKAPFLLKQVGGMCIWQHREASRLPELLNALSDEIKKEAAGREYPKPSIAPSVPLAFRAAFAGLFPELHGRVHVGLLDSSRTHEVLVTAVTEFLSHSSHDFESFDDLARAKLDEIADRCVAAENEEYRQEPRPAPPSPVALDLDYRKSRLPDWVIQSVEKKLRPTVRLLVV